MTLVVRRAQLHAVAHRSIDAFLQQVHAHVAQHFPAVHQAMPAEALDSTLREVLDRATQHGFETERDLISYVNLACVFGAGFDRDASMTWVAQAMAEPGPAALRMSRLITAGLRHEAQGRGLLAQAVDAPQPVSSADAG